VDWVGKKGSHDEEKIMMAMMIKNEELLNPLKTIRNSVLLLVC